MRVCDEAAQTIAVHSKTLSFDMEGSLEDSDRQIELMRRRDRQDEAAQVGRAFRGATAKVAHAQGRGLQAPNGSRSWTVRDVRSTLIESERVICHKESKPCVV